MNGLHVERAGAVVRVRIDAPPANLFTPQMTAELIALLGNPPSGAHVVHLSAAGDAFCLGRAPFRSGVEELQEDVRGLVGLNRALVESPAVTVVELQGDAAGFGAGVVALSDVAIASPEAGLSFPEVDAGFAPALVLSWLVPIVGRQAAFWLTATGTRISANEALRLGLITAVATDAGALAERAAAAIELLVAKPRSVHRDIKRLMRFYAALPDGARDDVAAEQLSYGAFKRALAE